MRQLGSKLEKISFAFWFFLGIKIFLIFLIFQKNPQLGTFFTGAISLGFFVLILFMIFHDNVKINYKRILKIPAVKLILVYFFWVLSTMLWTSAEPLFVVFGFYFIMLIDFFSVFLLFSTNLDKDKIFIKSVQGFVIGAFIVSLVALFLTSGTYYGRLGDSEFLHPNNLGNHLAIATLFSIFLIFNSKKNSPKFIWDFIFLILAIALVLSFSNVSLFAFLIAFFVYVLFARIKIKTKIFIIILIILIIVIFLEPINNYLSKYFYEIQGGNALATISGRTLIWQKTFDMIKDNPFLGYGFLSYRYVGPQTSSQVITHTAHNEWLHHWFSLGIIGLVLSFLIYFSYFANVIKNYKNPKFYFALSLFIYFLLRGVLEANPVGLVYPFTIMLLILSCINKIGLEDN